MVPFNPPGFGSSQGPSGAVLYDTPHGTGIWIQPGSHGEKVAKRQGWRVSKRQGSGGRGATAGTAGEDNSGPRPQSGSAYGEARGRVGRSWNKPTVVPPVPTGSRVATEEAHRALPRPGGFETLPPRGSKPKKTTPRRKPTAAQRAFSRGSHRGATPY